MLTLKEQIDAAYAERDRQRIAAMGDACAWTDETPLKGTAWDDTFAVAKSWITDAKELKACGAPKVEYAAYVAVGRRFWRLARLHGGRRRRLAA
jgi:hypothetical protein